MDWALEPAGASVSPAEMPSKEVRPGRQHPAMGRPQGAVCRDTPKACDGRNQAAPLDQKIDEILIYGTVTTACLWLVAPGFCLVTASVAGPIAHGALYVLSGSSPGRPAHAELN